MVVKFEAGLTIKRVLTSYPLTGDDSGGDGIAECDPGGVRQLCLKKCGHSIDKDGEDAFALQAACLPQTQDALHKAVTFIWPRAKAPLSPLHCEAQWPFGKVVGRRNSKATQKDNTHASRLRQSIKTTAPAISRASKKRF